MTVKKGVTFHSPLYHATSRITEVISVIQDSHLDEPIDHNDDDDDSSDAVVFTKLGPHPMSICWALEEYVL